MSQSATALLIAIPSLLLAVAGIVNSLSSRKEIRGKTETVWMTLTKESTDLVLQRLEELKRENLRLKRENERCNQDMDTLKAWLRSQGIRVPPKSPLPPEEDDSGEIGPRA